MKVTIEQLNYFGESNDNQEFNGKALYRKYGRLYLVHVWVDFFNKAIHIAHNQPKECKVLAGLAKALNDFGKANYKF